VGTLWLLPHDLLNTIVHTNILRRMLSVIVSSTFGTDLGGLSPIARAIDTQQTENNAECKKDAY